MTKPVKPGPTGRARLFDRPDVLLVDADAPHITMPAPPPLAMAHTAVPVEDEFPPAEREPERPDTGHLDFRPARIFVGAPPSAKVSLRERLAAAGLATPVENSEEEAPTPMAAAHRAAGARPPPTSEEEVRKLWEDLDVGTEVPARVVPVARTRVPLSSVTPTMPRRPAGGERPPPPTAVRGGPWPGDGAEDLPEVEPTAGVDALSMPEHFMPPPPSPPAGRPRSTKRRVEDGVTWYLVFAGLVIMAIGIWMFILFLPESTPEIEAERARAADRAREAAEAVEQARLHEVAAASPTAESSPEAEVEPPPSALGAGTGTAAPEPPPTPVEVVASMAPADPARAPTAPPPGAIVAAPTVLPVALPPGLLRVTSDKKAAIVIDGKPQGTVTPEAPLQISLPSGDHRLRVTPAGGGTSREQMVRVDPNAATAVEMDFVPDAAPPPAP